MNDIMLRNLSNLSVFLFWLSKADWSQRGHKSNTVTGYYLNFTFEITLWCYSGGEVQIWNDGVSVMRMNLDSDDWG